MIDFFFKIPIFSLAIFSKFVPKKFIWSIEIGVIIEHKELFIIFVASYFPPKPVSNNTRSESILEKARNAAAVVISKKVIDCPLFLSSHSSRSELRYLLLTKLELILILSLNFIR